MDADTNTQIARLRSELGQREQAALLQSSQNRILEAIVARVPLAEVLTRVALLMESQAQGMICSILLLDEDGLHARDGAGPSLPDAYRGAIDGVAIGPRAGSCGTAMFRAQTVIVSDIQTDPLWSRWRELAAQYDLRACWSTPILSHEGQVLGSFAMYFREVRVPTEAERALVPIATHLSCIAIERDRAEAALRSSQDLYRLITDASQDLIALLDVAGRVVFVSPSVRSILGWEAEDLLAQIGSDLVHPEDARDWARAWKRILNGETASFCHRSRSALGGWRWLDGWGRIVDYHGQPHVLAVSRDITERRQLEEDLRQSQKMESIGRLAGGVAHDFNNLLTAINGYSALCLEDLDPSHELYEPLFEILKAGDRAANLTSQLLAYSRKQMIAPRLSSLNSLVADIDGMLRSLLGEAILLTTELPSGLDPVLIDRSQVERILINLVVNARDAMPDGGSLRIETANVSLLPTSQGAAADSGPFVMLAVSDSGAGMSDEVMAHLFEPFYTTKRAGKGTGLGLSTVYGIVAQSGGHIAIESAHGEGTTFRIYFPRAVLGADSDGTVALEPLEAEEGRETILLVEDEPVVSRFIEQALRSRGYTVLGARDGTEALRTFARHADQVQLVITDVLMPGMGGRELADEIRRSQPEMPVLFVSGFARQHPLSCSGPPRKGEEFLQKPFSPSELARSIRRILALR